MADYVFKVQVLLPGNVLETVILRQYIDPVDRCFDKFKANLIQRYNILTNTSFKMMWIGKRFICFLFLLRKSNDSTRKMQYDEIED